MTLAEYLQAFFAVPAKVSLKTLERYLELAEKQIVPHLGALKLQKLRPEHVDQWHGTLLEAGLAPRTVGHAHRLLVRVLGYAVENGTLARNVAAIRKPPKVEEREIEILTAEQIAEVRAKLAGHAPWRRLSSLPSPPACGAASCSASNGATWIWTPARCASSGRSRRPGPAFG